VVDPTLYDVEANSQKPLELSTLAYWTVPEYLVESI
jgi:hypothetical protein